MAGTLGKTPVEGHLLSIHYFECIGDGAVFVDCNCRDLSNDCHQSTHRKSSTPSSIPWSTLSSSASSSPTTDQFSQAMQPVYRASPYSTQPSSRASYSTTHANSRPAYEYQYSTGAVQPGAPRTSQSYGNYAVGHNGIPVNTAGGVLATQLTGIHIKGLSYSTSQKSLSRFLAEMGCPPMSCTLKRDSDGKSKGSALANYGSQAVAQQAVAMLDGQKLDKRSLRVKLDGSQAVVVGDAGSQTHRSRHSSTKPMVLDGSTGRRDPSS